MGKNIQTIVGQKREKWIWKMVRKNKPLKICDGLDGAT